MTAQTMRADTKQVAGAKADVSNLLGTWVNSKPHTDHIAEIVVIERDGALLIRPSGASDDDLVDWGEAPATPYVASGTTEVAGFHARYEFGPVRIELAANEKLGILVIQSYTSFHDDSGRLSHYSREFFHQSPTRLAADVAERTGVGSLVGDWANSNPSTAWIKGFTLAAKEPTFTLHAFGANEPTDWGEIELTPYHDNIDEPAFHAVYDLGAVEAVLAANTNKGLIIIAAFLRYKDSDLTNFLCREFFFRENQSPRTP